MESSQISDSHRHHLQTGGLYLKNVNKKGFRPILDMIVHPSSTLKNLTYDSLKGFMAVLTVDRENSEYNYLSETSPMTFSKPVTEYLLKIAIITETEKKIGIIKTVSEKSAEVIKEKKKEEEDEDGIIKYSETKQSFIEEAKIQQKIWYTSLSNGKDQLCPSIANFSLFSNKNSKRLLNILKNKTNDKVLRHIVFNWLYDAIDHDQSNEIGIITMPLIQKSSTFSSYVESYENGKSTRRDFLLALESFLIQIVRLWIDNRIYHADLHMNNCLIYKDYRGEIKCVIIDFGKIIDFNSFIRKYQEEDGLTKDFFILLNERIDKKIRELNFTLLLSTKNNAVVAPLTTSQKIDGIERLYKDVYDFDSMYYKKVYDLDDGNGYDFYKLISSLPPSEKNGILERAYDRLHKMYSIVDKSGQGRNRDFFIENKDRFVFIVTDTGYSHYYYSLKGYNARGFRHLENKKKMERKKTIKKEKIWRKGKGIVDERNFLKRFFLNTKKRIRN